MRNSRAPETNWLTPTGPSSAPASSFGIVAGTGTNQIPAINAAIAILAAGGYPSELVFGPGIYSVAPAGDPYLGQGGSCIRLASNVTLRLQAGAKLRVLPNSGLYGALIYGYRVSGCQVLGPGTIDLNVVNNPVAPSGTEGHECHAVRFQCGCVDCTIDGVIADTAGGRHVLIFDKQKSAHDAGASTANTNAKLTNFRIHFVDPTLETFTAPLGAGINQVATLTRGSTPAWIVPGEVLVLEGGGNLPQQATVGAVGVGTVTFSSNVTLAGYTQLRLFFDNTAAYLYAEGTMRSGRIYSDDTTTAAGLQTPWEAQGGPFTVDDIRSSNSAYWFDVSPDATATTPCFVDNIYGEGLGTGGMIIPQAAVNDVSFGKLVGRFTQLARKFAVSNGVGFNSAVGENSPSGRVSIELLILSWEDEVAGRVQGVAPSGTAINCAGEGISLVSYGTLTDIRIGAAILENPPYVGAHISGANAKIAKLSIERLRIINAGQNIQAPGAPSGLSIDGSVDDSVVAHLEIYDTWGAHRLLKGVNIAPGGTYNRNAIRHYRKNAADGFAIPDTGNVGWPIEDTNSARSWPTTIQQTDAAGNKVWGVDVYGRPSTKRGTAFPTVTATANVGTTGTVILEGDSTDVAGKITITPGGVGIAAGQLFTFNFGVAQPDVQYAVDIQQAFDDDGSGFLLNSASSSYAPSTRTVNGWQFFVNAVALTTGHKYVLFYSIAKYGS